MSTPIVDDRPNNSVLPILSGIQIHHPAPAPASSNLKASNQRLSTSSLQIVSSESEIKPSKQKRSNFQDLVIIKPQNKQVDVVEAKSSDETPQQVQSAAKLDAKSDGPKALPRLSDSNFNFWKVSGKDYIGNGMLGPSSRRTEPNLDVKRSMGENTYQSARNSLNSTHTGKFRSTGMVGYLDIGQFEATNTSQFYRGPKTQQRNGPGSIKGALSAQQSTTSPQFKPENTGTAWGLKLAKSEALHYETVARKLEGLQQQYCSSVNKAKGAYKANKFSDPTAMSRYLVGFCEELGEQIRTHSTLPLSRTFKVLECLFEQGAAFTEALADMRLEMQLQKEKSRQQQLEEAQAEEAKANVEVGSI